MDRMVGDDVTDSFTDIIGKISTLVGFGQQLVEIFGGSQPLTIGDIEAAIQQEVTAALLAQAIQTEIVNASATLQSAQDFMTIQYLDAVESGSSQDKLYILLTEGEMTNYVSAMITHVEALRIWMAGFIKNYDADPSDLTDLKTGATGFSVSVGTYVYLTMVFRERAKQATEESDKQRHLADMRKYARLGVQRIGPNLIKVIKARRDSLIYRSDDNPNITDVGGIPIKNYCTIDSLNDAWVDTWVFAFKAQDDPSMNYAAALHLVEQASRNLLWSGAQADADDFLNTLNDGWLRVPINLGQGDTPWAQNFGNTCLDPYTAFGQWVADTRTALVGLDAVAFGYVGSEQDDWSWCSSCGGLYFAGTASVCPAANGGPHVHETPSANYVLRGDPTEPAPRPMQGNWCWCNKCSGLFFGKGPGVCAAGGQHDSTGSGAYELDYAPIPGPGVLGLPDAQDNWRWCSKCSTLHFGTGPSACPAGGAHSSTGSADYWLSSLGTQPQPS